MREGKGWIWLGEKVGRNWEEKRKGKLYSGYIIEKDQLSEVKGWGRCTLSLRYVLSLFNFVECLLHTSVIKTGSSLLFSVILNLKSAEYLAALVILLNKF